MKKKIITVIVLLVLIAGSVIFLTHTTEPEELQSFQCYYYLDDETDEDEEENTLWTEYLSEEDMKNAIILERPEVAGAGKASADMYPEGYYQKGVLQCNIMLNEGTIGIQLYDEDLNLLKEWTGITSDEKSFTDEIEGDIVSNCRYTVIVSETDVDALDGSVQLIITATRPSRLDKIIKSIREKMK